MAKNLTEAKKARAVLVAPAVKVMGGDSAYELKESFYKALEGINGLVEGLELLAVIAPEGPERQAVLDELKVAPTLGLREALMIRTIRELIDALEEAAEQVGDDAEIRIGHQPNWPLELSIARVVTSADLYLR